MDPLHSEGYGEEGIAWPSYVDFLATFSFVLFIFIGSLVFLMHGQLGDRVFERKVKPYVQMVLRKGIDVRVDGRRIRFDLRRHVDFENNSAVLAERHMVYLRRLAKELPAGISAAGQCKIVVLGKADSAKFRGDPFGNWSLSARRALAVLQFLYNCTDCGYGPEIQKTLVLLGEGDVQSARPGADDRRVDLVIDCTREVIQ
ncbi:MAG: hypothetical protein ABI693_19615 [Bryobacteraceae bacterium]